MNDFGGAEKNNAWAAKDSGWEKLRNTKLYDLLAAMPLILWLAFGLHAQLPLLIRRATELLSGTIDPSRFLQFVAFLGSFSFNIAMIYFLVVRTKPIARSKGLLPRITAVAGAFFGTSILLLPAAPPSLPLQIVSNLLIFGGSFAALFVLTRLGRAFAMMPEARELNISGPYAFARHPLYAFEVVIYLGLMLQFQQPWALIIMTTGFFVMYCRSTFEERILEERFPQYRAYRARTARFIPGVF